MQPERIKRVSQTPDLIPSIACMLLMFQAYLVAPLSPTLAKEFSSALVPLAVPAFAIPFAVAAAGTVFLKPAADLRNWFLVSLATLCTGTWFLSMANSAGVFLFLRALTGFGTGIMLPTALLLAIWPANKKRSADHMVLIIFALATGMTFGPSLGGWLNGVIGWRCLYQLAGMLAGLLFFMYFLGDARDPHQVLPSLKGNVQASSISDRNSRYIYSFVFLTGVFHSGVFVWITSYFTTHYKVDEFHISTDLFIFGLPGFLVSLLMYYYQLDRKVINILYFSLGLTVAGILVLMWNLPLWLAESLLGVISVGFGCSQPLFIGIIKLPPRRISLLRPVALGSGLLFAGYGCGPLFMTAFLSLNLGAAMFFLIVLVLALAFISRRVWKVSRRKIN